MKRIDFSNPLRNVVGNPTYKKEPSPEEALNAILDGMAAHSGTCWAPVSLEGGQDIMFNQCPGACGHVWRINIQDSDTANWIVRQVNERRYI